MKLKDKINNKLLVASMSLAGLMTSVHADDPADVHSVEDVMKLDAVSGKDGILTKVGPLIRIGVYGVMGAAMAYFIFKIAFGLLTYFGHKGDPQEEKKYKEMVKNSFKGLAVASVVSILIELLLSIFGLSGFFTL